MNGNLVLFAAFLVAGLCGMPLLVACSASRFDEPPDRGDREDANEIDVAERTDEPEPFRDSASDQRNRARMVAEQLAGRDIVDTRVLDAMGTIPRQVFVPEDMRASAYDDWPLPIGFEQTISQPYIVALMTQLAEPELHKTALDVGTGSGYQAAVLAELVRHVTSIEIVKPLARAAQARLRTLGYHNVTVKAGDGYQGCKAAAPFDIIIVAAAPDHVPQPLVDQLAIGGKLVIPVGGYYQELLVIEKRADGTTRQRSVAPVAFVPMTGQAQTH